MSESEYEDDETNEVVLPQTLKSRGNLENNKSAIRLHEIGPRLTLELTKIQDDLFKGDVLYHSTIIKSEEELLQIKKSREEKKRLKEMRKRVQNENVAKKEAKKGDHKKRSMAVKPNDDANPNEVEMVDDDAEYYRDEVGEEPDEGKNIAISLPTCSMNKKITFAFYRIVPNEYWWWSQASFCTETNEIRSK